MKETNVTLHPVFSLHGYAMNLPENSGKHTYRFRVQSGDIEIHHHSYDGIAGLWCLPPESGDQETIVLHSGEEAVITIDSRVHDCEPDYVEIANSHYAKRAVFSYQELRKEADCLASGETEQLAS